MHDRWSAFTSSKLSASLSRITFNDNGFMPLEWARKIAYPLRNIQIYKKKLRDSDLRRFLLTLSTQPTSTLASSDSLIIVPANTWPGRAFVTWTCILICAFAFEASTSAWLASWLCGTVSCGSSFCKTHYAINIWLLETKKYSCAYLCSMLYWCTTCGDSETARSLVAAPRVWNRLPTELKLVRSSTTTFRRHLKTFLFHSVYNCNWLCNAPSGWF